MADHTVEAGGVRLAAEEAGDGIPVVLLHGLTATRRYVVMGSRMLERSGHRVVLYDARGHGHSSPAPEPEAYRFADLDADLEAVLDALDVRRAVLVGGSMGAHTVLSFALRAPERVAAVALITPAFDPRQPEDPGRLARWDALSDGLRERGVEGFLAAYGEPEVPERWRETVLKVLRQRLAEHYHPEAVADALRAVPRARPFDAMEELGALEMPAVIVASRDKADPEHPLAVGEAYAEAMPDAELLVEQPDESPLAWQGGRVSRAIAGVAVRAAQEGWLP